MSNQPPIVDYESKSPTSRSSGSSRALWLNYIAVLGSLASLAASIIAEPSIEWRARGYAGPGEWNRLYLIAPVPHVLLAVMSIATLPFCFRQRKVFEPIVMTCLVLLITWMQIESGISGYRRYSSQPAPPSAWQRAASATGASGR